MPNTTHTQPKHNPANWQALCAAIHARLDVGVWLDIAKRLDDEGRDIGRHVAAAYRYNKPHIDVLRGHGELFNAHHYDRASFADCVMLASVHARIMECSQ